MDEANFLKSDYAVDSKQIEKVLQNSKENAINYAKGLQDIGKEWQTDARNAGSELSELTKKAAPNLKNVKEYYGNELGKFKNEILDDKSIKALTENLYVFFF